MKLLMCILFRDDPLPPGDLIFIWDGMHPQMLQTMEKRAPAKVYRNSRRITLNYCEEHLRARFERVRDETVYQQHETLLVASVAPIRLQQIPKMHFTGTSKGLSWFPVPLPSWDATEGLVDVETMELITQGHIQEAAPGEGADVKKEKVGTGKVQVFPHRRHIAQNEELLHSFHVHWTIEFFAGDGEMAVAAMQSGVDYVGFVFNSAHKKHIVQKLDKAVFDSLAVPGIVSQFLIVWQCSFSSD